MVHSIEYITDQRYDWHNKDYLELLAKRWNLNQYSDIADIGCGLLHWSKLLFPFFKQPFNLTAIDFEKHYIDILSRLKDEYKNNGINLIPLHSAAEDISLPDNSFDLITCQTLLIHVADRKKVLSEFKRLLKHNGKIIISEPNNMMSSLQIDRIKNDLSINEIKHFIDFELFYAYGKNKLGLGNSFSVESIINELYELNFEEIEIYKTDKVDLQIFTSTKQVDELWNEILENEKEKSKCYLFTTSSGKKIYKRYWKTLESYFNKMRKEITKNNQYVFPDSSCQYLISCNIGEI